MTSDHREEHYFAYGSNLDPDRMLERCPSARLVERARLRDHEIEFKMLDERSGGTVATVAPRRGCVVEGVVYRISPHDLLVLDRYEDVELGDYLRMRRDVLLSDGATVSAWVYFPGKPTNATGVPSKSYAGAVLRGATHHKLSPAYLELLSRLLDGKVGAMKSDQERTFGSD